jgi:DNA-binding Lrp family transcriptional regulator
LFGQKQGILKFEKYSGEDKQVTIDEKDIKILKELSQTANLSIIELAKRTKLSVDVIKYRLKSLNQRLIGSYRIMLNLNKLGYYHYVIMLRVRQATKQDEEKLISWCSLKRSVIYCTKRIGYFDFEINVAIKNINELNQFLSELKTEFGEMIDSYDTIINSQLLKLDYAPF